MSHGATSTDTRPAAGSAIRTSPPESSSTRVPWASPCSALAPAKLATNGVAGDATSSAGDASCVTTPRSITTTRSASDAASSNEWVTTSAGRPDSRSVDASSAATAPRVAGSSADERLVEQQQLGAPAPARAQGPPAGARRRTAGAASRRPGGRCRSARAAHRRPRRERRRPRWRARSCAGTARSPGTRTRPGASRPAGRRRRRTSAGRGTRPCPTAGVTSPAISRSRVDLPAPEGPAIATGRSASSCTWSVNSRSGRVRSA